MLPRLRFFLKQAISGLWRSLGVTTLSVVTIGIALGLLSTFGVIVRSLGRLAEDAGKDVEISAYLSRTLPAASAEARAQEIRGWPDVAGARFVTSTAAIDAFRAGLGRDAVILEGLPADVLPPSIEVRLDEHRWTADGVRAIARKLESVPGVEDVRYGQDEIERINALFAFARAAGLVVGIALCLAVVLLVSNTIRLTVYARRDEIEIMSLVGATDLFVRTPFVIEGAIQGLLGGLTATVGLVVMREALVGAIQRGMSYALGPMELELLPLELVGSMIGLGVVLGLVGSLFAVGKFVK